MTVASVEYPLPESVDCPQCGEQAPLIHVLSDAGDYPKVHCPNCGTTGQGTYIPNPRKDKNGRPLFGISPNFTSQEAKTRNGYREN